MNENETLSAALNEVIVDQLLDALPDAWQEKLRPQVIELLNAGGDQGVKAAEALIREKIAEWSLIEGQPQYRWDDELGAIPSL